MERLTYSYAKGLDLIEVIAATNKGDVKGNIIRANNKVYKGTQVVLKIEDEISAMIVDMHYKKKTVLQIRNGSNIDHFIGIYFYVTNNNIDLVLKNHSVLLGVLDYNVSVVDSELFYDYIIEANTSSYTVCLFLYKTAFKRYLEKFPQYRELSKYVLDSKRNTIITIDRMNIESLILIKKFQEISYDNLLFDFYFKGLVYKLMSNHFDQLLTKKIVVGKVIGEDVKSIIVSKAFLLEHIEDSFPGIDFLADMAVMSATKYKKMFNKIVGVSPGTFFYDNKLVRAKELLETGQYTVGEISYRLKYSNVSYLAKKFNENYGVFPKAYQQLR